MSKIEDLFCNLFVFAWDNSLFLLNLLTPKLKATQVVPDGCPGHNGKWPEYVPPKEGDSRSACPMLNAMANHGILPHDGKNISFKELNVKVRETFNFAPSFCFFVPHFSAGFLKKSYWHDKFDLSELDLHTSYAIEHDASLTRQDAALVPDQGKPDQQLVADLLKQASGKAEDGGAQMTTADMSRALSKRRADARKTNKAYTESFFHNMFGSAKYVSFPLCGRIGLIIFAAAVHLRCSPSSVAASTISSQCSPKSVSPKTGSLVFSIATGSPCSSSMLGSSHVKEASTLRNTSEKKRQGPEAFLRKCTMPQMTRGRECENGRE